MPIDPSVESKVQGDQEEGKSRDGDKGKLKEAGIKSTEGSDFAYEYVQVSQVSYPS